MCEVKVNEMATFANPTYKDCLGSSSDSRLLYLNIDVARTIRLAHSTRYDVVLASHRMMPDSFTGIVGGFVPPNPSAVHSLTLEGPPGMGSPRILLLSQFPSNPMAELIPKNIAISDDTTTLIKELEGILRKLPSEEVPSADIYERNIGIFWQGPDGFLWANSAPEGCSQSVGGTTVTVTKENKDAFNRAVEITEILVERGVAQEGI
jgi:hypothetical protein